MFTVNFVCRDFGFIPCFTCSPFLCQIVLPAPKFKENVHNVLFGANTAYVDLIVLIILLYVHILQYVTLLCIHNICYRSLWPGRQILPVLLFLIFPDFVGGVLLYPV